MNQGQRCQWVDPDTAGCDELAVCGVGRGHILGFEVVWVCFRHYRAYLDITTAALLREAE